MKIKSQRNTFPIKEGDYLWFNGVVWGFTPKDKTILPMVGWTKPHSATISKKEVARVLKEYLHTKREKDFMTYYHFAPKVGK